MRLKPLARMAVAVIALAPGVAVGQSAAEHIAAGDRERAALRVADALKEFEAALALDPGNYNVLIKAAQAAVDLGEFNASTDQRATLYENAEQYARRAIAANPNDADGHFELAEALGRKALSRSPRDRVGFAKQVREEALAALALDPRHSGALHVMGVWNAEVMRLNGITRVIAKRFLGGAVFGEANWGDAQKYLERSVSEDPDRIAHRLDLAAVYADRDQRARAIEELEWIAHAPATEFNDVHYKEEAARRLKALR